MLAAVPSLTPTPAAIAQDSSAQDSEALLGDPPHQGPNPEIRCICVFRGQEFRLGQVVCMETHLGTVLTRCEMHLNNTSWTPSQNPCTISQSRSPRPAT